jgi:predicted Fe-Mo cluster-binding NifX family protein
MKNLMRALLFSLLLLGCAAVADAATVIAVASETTEETGLVSREAARSPYYLVFAGTGELLEVIYNPYGGEREGTGQAVVNLLAQKGIGLVVAESFSSAMIGAMEARGMKHLEFRGVAKDAVDRLVLPGERKGTKKGDN